MGAACCHASTTCMRERIRADWLLARAAPHCRCAVLHCVPPAACLLPRPARGGGCRALPPSLNVPPTPPAAEPNERDQPLNLPQLKLDRDESLLALVRAAAGGGGGGEQRRGGAVWKRRERRATLGWLATGPDCVLTRVCASVCVYALPARPAPCSCALPSTPSSCRRCCPPGSHTT